MKLKGMLEFLQLRRRPRFLKVKSLGRHHDLEKIFTALNNQFFNSAVNAVITWGRSRPKRRRRVKRARHITLGSYCDKRKLITIHPNLDRPGVPTFFVEAIVFHEMCHQVVREENKNGRRRLHTSKFKDVEKTFPLLNKARRWAKENMECILKVGNCLPPDLVLPLNAREGL